MLYRLSYLGVLTPLNITAIEHFLNAPLLRRLPEAGNLGLELSQRILQTA